MTRGAGAPSLVLAAGLAIAPQAGALETALDVGVGYRRDSLKWSIAADLSGTAQPNVLSELSWTDIEIAELRLGLKADGNNGVHARGSLAFGTVLDGKNRDSDYLGDNRTLEFSRSENDTSGDDVLDGFAAIGYRFRFTEGTKTAQLTPLLGLALHRQHLRLTDGVQVIPPIGPFPGLNSTYRTEWASAWVGLELIAPVSSTFNGYVQFEYHWADYSAEATWNLRSDFRQPTSFEHDANGQGNVLSFGLTTLPAKGVWSWRVGFDVRRWNTDPGIDRVFFSNGTVAVTRLNEVEWRSFAVNLVAQRHF